MTLPASGPRRLRYEIARVSGEDPDHPARHLMLQHPECQGWQTPRFCSYPQEVEVKLECQAVLHQIQILSHEYKIPQIVEIYLSSLPAGCTDASQAVEHRLGHLKFNDNERSGHQARELKSVSLDRLRAMYVRLVLNKSHVNHHNIYNQVGIVALNIVGASKPESHTRP
jgi:centrosomal protein CEP104